MKINRKLTIKELLDKLGYEQYVNEEVLKTLKNEGPKEGEVELFNMGRFAFSSEVLKEYESRNLEPDLGAVLTYLIENPTLVDEKLIGVQMTDDRFVYVVRFGDKRRVVVDRSDSGWDGDFWLAGRRKSALKTKNLGTLKVSKCMECSENHLWVCSCDCHALQEESEVSGGGGAADSGPSDFGGGGGGNSNNGGNSIFGGGGGRGNPDYEIVEIEL